MKKFFCVVLLILCFCQKKTTVVETKVEEEVIDPVIMNFAVEKEPDVIEEIAIPMTTTKKMVTVYFDYKSSKLRTDQVWKISNIVHPVEITGHTCPIGGDSYNYTLGLRRCYAVEKFFIKSGIQVLSVKSYGERKLVSLNENEYGLNRRCEIHYFDEK